MLALPVVNLKNKVSATEWQIRVDLAACYRLIAMHGWDDLIYTHISARIPGTEHVLINAFGLRFDEITASNLVKIDMAGNIVDADCPFEFNPAGFTIHSAIHQARHDEMCVLHVHCNEAVAVASLQEGLLPISQYAMFALASLSYHDYEGLAVNEDEKLRLQQDLGDKNFMLLRNHGAITLGKTIGDAFMHMYDLIRACQIQIQVLSTGSKPVLVEQSIVDGIKAQANIVHTGLTGGQKAWPAMLRRVYQADASFAQ
ncbi:Ribulose-5-phosphate 4-epimerase/Fuculose-1-phosphate aldolase [Colwellia chukchiensis]|uniref:Ribulose-5-phosphate 4-epimerase/Fuculose-1-phosphate aldolase n=1 Tax=Colwellia chukchiensis TaxID=641665 RepID=A0A1H7GX29_9GAMM|nr:class II aldolase/adducin family protein [Colwellia chukchiensis]SEK42594.1 Ribulose-5-phosphate 4-epimerase/Fuculose-1-phosphate aldolase [Colwellia chukchiensis]